MTLEAKKFMKATKNKEELASVNLAIKNLTKAQNKWECPEREKKIKKLNDRKLRLEAKEKS